VPETESVEPVRLQFLPLGLVVKANQCGYQHDHGHRSGEHYDQHESILLVLTTGASRFGFVIQRPHRSRVPYAVAIERLLIAPFSQSST
jgi:hypothetical protein